MDKFKCTCGLELDTVDGDWEINWDFNINNPGDILMRCPDPACDREYWVKWTPSEPIKAN